MSEVGASLGRSPMWHPFANMAAVSGHEITIVRGHGCMVYDAAGRGYLDAIASLWYCNVGHGRTELAQEAARQMGTLASFHTFERYSNPPAEQLCERLAALAPMSSSRVFLTAGGGSDAVDTAAKLARAYWSAVGRPAKQRILARSYAYHGMNAYGTSLGGIPGNLDAYGPLVTEVGTVAWDDPAALADAIDATGADRVAAFFCEPVVGAGGVLLPPAGYLDAVQAICHDRDVLFVVDEVITGFGRLGAWFGAERLGLQPDLLVCAKGLTSGYMPLGAVLVSATVAAPFWEAGTERIFRHGYTYSGHPTACAVA
ncbi:MAG TPA: aminotransferase class III-fold pyridoxal phosphate-dependent enzyme, partial [Verrucomicrobiae bacterium]|nr:aminotransferase class III-fold pyridoxal phosphate-dependent enzyme [Verrucomicrobiae bacterium]